ncbi:MAG: DUF1329 domain-containing protein [Deltaproteobacteria bacterium]|nr:MAG: DUF1329 domain-containing protein [Deltaproteobacteria bacterium]
MKRLLYLLISSVVVLMFVGSFCTAYADELESQKDATFQKSYLKGEIKYKVDKSNLNKYKDKLTLGLAEIIRTWDYTANVYETIHDYTPIQEYIDSTEKYKGSARVNKKGGLENYTAGLPFPDPKTGIEVMYNYEYKYSGDDFWWTTFQFNSISATGKIKVIKSNYKRLAYQGRLTLGTIPNPDKVELKEILAFTYPEDIAGLALLTVRYQDGTKADDAWMYIPTIRRIRRISTAQRSDTFGGTDYTWDDARGLSGKIAGYNWTMIGKKEMIVPYHALSNDYRFKGKTPHPDDIRYELREVWIVDGVNKERDYSYGKIRFYIDPDSWAICASDHWDRRGTLWKYNEVGLVVDKKDHVMFQYYQNMFDLIAKRSTLSTKTALKTNLGLKETDFTTTKLQSQSR